MAFTKILKEDYNNKGVIGLPDAPQLSTTAMQEKFEELSTDVIIPKHNALIDELESISGASNIGTTNGNVQSDIDSFNGKIATYNGDISQLKTDMTQAKADITTLKADDVTEKADIENLKTDNTANKAQIATNKSDIATLKTTSDNHDKKITDLETDNTKNKADITSIKSDVAVLNAVKHTHTNKTVIDALTKDSDGDLNFEGHKIKGGGGTTDAYSHIKVGNKTLDASGPDTFELVAGSNVSFAVNEETKAVTINSAGGGGGTSTGDMLKSDFVLDGGTGQVLSAKEADHAANAYHSTEADHSTNADNATNAVLATSATTAGQVGSAITSVLEGLSDNGGKLEYLSSPIGKDVVVDNTTITKDASTEALSVASTITNKLAKLDTNTVAEEGQALAWDGEKYTPQTVMGGHEMIDNYEDILNATIEDKKVVNAVALAEFTNTRTDYIVATLKQGENTVGTWFNEGETWIVDNEHMIVDPLLVETTESINLEFCYWSGSAKAIDETHYFCENTTPLHITGYQWDNVRGGLTIRCFEDAPNDISVIVKVIRVRDNVVDVREVG